jgi:hypothetical protein
LKGADEDRALVLINKDWNSPQKIELAGLDAPAGSKLRRFVADGRLEESPVPPAVELSPAEIALVV